MAQDNNINHLSIKISVNNKTIFDSETDIIANFRYLEGRKIVLDNINKAQQKLNEIRDSIILQH